MIHVHDSIDSSGYPLAFRSRPGGERPPLFRGEPGEAVLRVDARAMGAHQKEAVVHEGDGGPTWRTVSDEGPYLKGTDLAPFPLGFFNAGLQGDLLGRIARRAAAEGVDTGRVELELDNLYSFGGSFLKGDGRGTAYPAEIRLAFGGGSGDASTIAGLVRRALAESPAIAALTTPLDSTFALYVNGIRREVTMTRPSTAADAPDPLKTYREPPSPVGDAGAAAGLITKIPQPPVETQVMPASGSRFELRVIGRSTLVDAAAGRVEVESFLKAPAGSHFGFATDEAGGGDAAAPSGLALLSAGISYCYMTQLLRYAEYLKYKVRAIRVVQYNPYRVERGADGALAGGVGPVDTHLFLHGDEPDEVMQKLLVMGAQTCYLHAALKAALPPVVTLTVDGQPVEIG